MERKAGNIVQCCFSTTAPLPFGDQGDELSVAIRRVLESRGIGASTEKTDSATVVIHSHPVRGIHRSAQDVAACPYPQGVKLVLLLRPVTFRTINRSVPDWAESADGRLRVLCIDPVPGIFEALKAMLDWVNPNNGVTNSN